MSVQWQNVTQTVRYWFFPEARLIDEKATALDAVRSELKRRKTETDYIVKNANRPDVLRNLVVAMTEDRKGG